jgi:hypothetical protein
MFYAIFVLERELMCRNAKLAELKKEDTTAAPRASTTMVTRVSGGSVSLEKL